MQSTAERSEDVENNAWVFLSLWRFLSFCLQCKKKEISNFIIQKIYKEIKYFNKILYFLELISLTVYNCVSQIQEESLGVIL